MNAESDLEQQLRRYVDDEPPRDLTFETVLAEARRSRRRRRLAGLSGVAVGILVAGTVGGYAVGFGPDRTSNQAEPATIPHTSPEEVQAAFAQGVQDRLDTGAAQPGGITHRGRYYGGSHPDDAIQVDVGIDGDQVSRIIGIFTRSAARPADSDRCADYRWGGQACRKVDVDDGVILITRSGHVAYDQSLGQRDMEVILLRADGTGNRVTQYNFDPDDASSPGTAFPMTENEAVSLVQDPALDYRG